MNSVKLTACTKMMATSTVLFLVLGVWLSEPTTTAGQDTAPPPSGVCQLSTCELLRELGATEQKMMAMEEKMRTMEARLQASEDQAQELGTVKTKVAAMESELRASRSEIEQLKSKNAVKVAFSAYLGGYGHVGPYDTEKTLAYQNVLTNIGNAYKPATGHFIAPVRGIYYFYICYHGGQQTGTAIVLYKNSQLIASASHAGSEEKTLNENGSNGITLQLEAEDQVYVVLRARTWVWDGPNHDTVFTGFLLKQL